MVDESLWDPVECAVVIKAGAADVGNVYISESGGVLAASRNLAMCAMCEAAGITGLIGAMPELGIGTAAQIHLALASTNIGHDCDTCGSLYFDEDYLVTALDFSDGVAKPPPGTIGLRSTATRFLLSTSLQQTWDIPTMLPGSSMDDLYSLPI